MKNIQKIVMEGYDKRKRSTFHLLFKKYVRNMPDSIVNFVIHPIKSYFDPLLHTNSGADLDVGLENQRDQVSIDEYFIEQFHKGIEFHNGKYYVELDRRAQRNHLS